MCQKTDTGQKVIQELAYLIKRSSAETGYGEVVVRIEQMKHGKMRLFLQAGSCHRYIVLKTDFEKALESLIGDTTD
jgi:hypothetical protein